MQDVMEEARVSKIDLLAIFVKDEVAAAWLPVLVAWEFETV